MSFLEEEIMRKVHPIGMSGKTHTEESRRKMKLSARNRPPVSLETREKRSKTMKGVKKSPLSVQKMIETKRKNPRLGDKAANWKGGTTRLSELIRSCFKYRQWRADVFQRDNYTCIICYKRSTGDIEADHIKPQRAIIKDNNLKTSEEARNCEELWNINNGRTLCKPCHTKTDTYRNSKTKYD